MNSLYRRTRGPAYAVERCLQRISEAAIRLGEEEASQLRPPSLGKTFAA